MSMFRILALAVAASSAYASAIYTYTSADFTTRAGYKYPTAAGYDSLGNFNLALPNSPWCPVGTCQHIVFSFTFDQALAPNLSISPIPLSWSLTDGVHTLTDTSRFTGWAGETFAPSSPGGFGTDASGMPTDFNLGFSLNWGYDDTMLFEASRTLNMRGAIYRVGAPVNPVDGSYAQTAELGTWTVTHAPEPGTWIAGLAIAGVVLRKALQSGR